MKQEEINEIRKQLWENHKKILARIEELREQGNTVDRLCWLGQQYEFSVSEIEYWKMVG